MHPRLAAPMLAIGLLAPTAVRSQQPATGWTPERMMEVKRVGSVRPSPDGKQVAFTVSEFVIGPEKSESITRVFVAPIAAAGPAPARMVLREDASASDPQWSPDGKALAFNYGRQVFITRFDGQPFERITEAPGGVASYTWSPNGKWIAYTSFDGPSEARRRAIQQKDDAYFVDEEIQQSRLYVTPIAADAAGKRTAVLLTPGDFAVGPQFNWSPDSSGIVFAKTRTPKPDDGWSSDVATVDVTSRVIKILAATPAVEGEAFYSPDGKTIAVVTSGLPPRHAQTSRIQLFPAGGGKPRTLPDTADSRPTLVGWSADGKELYYTETAGVLLGLFAITAETGGIRRLNAGPEYLSGISLDPSGRWFGCSSEQFDQAPEGAVSGASAFSPRVISHANAGLPALPFGTSEVIRWRSDRKWDVEGLLIYPPGYRPGARVPLVVQIHGGPAGAFGRQYLARPGLTAVAAYSAKGYAVLQPNPRGSIGYGEKFQDQNYRDWGGSDYRDIMAGVDHVIGMGVADPNRLGIMGWSYGGYLSGWTITQTDRFKAAAFGAGVSNLISQTGTTDIVTQRLGYFGAWPWDDPEIYLKRSPLLHAGKVKTPTLIQHGEVDRRVPITQSYEYYTALKKRGVPVRMLVLPRQAHSPGEPKMLLKVMNAGLEWFDRYLR